MSRKFFITDGCDKCPFGYARSRSCTIYQHNDKCDDHHNQQVAAGEEVHCVEGPCPRPSYCKVAIISVTEIGEDD